MTNNFQEKANFIWTVVDNILRGAFKAHDYGDVIYPSLCSAGLMACPAL